ncbi:aldehyde dehydrogenase family protein [Marinobacter sp. M3C]|jgi:aldehyde dehydrogenase (NAD+)|uniref:aldehyde dehydrogenase family protein n=1 Tax=unclassified Marinobacter TaxID=83889 RepID=UPI00200C112A|nr:MULTISPECIES: aldehyde dehydrogenase family protein [unclassified Marinobacter]MCL1476222.1 aldehyde dehydrogenase family protein [Marinobacter sp.]MCL1482977.1 aldehyde dehydrogenase family protein [Marinobacter sp.]UQG58126.1 aldehyde dehydrogenase family protein [Marinobacter sp. M4C]UQG60576.1 aldehyde dehydrogenase family protein [Marinobacter sp. M3C]UQG66931.1 aldehyde dehydrogenase family protein [Marinobacter sp. M2C]
MKTILINGIWQESADQSRIEVLAPATGQKFTELSRGKQEDIDLAVRSARHAFENDWGKYSATERGRLLIKIGTKIMENAEEIARVESQDTGKPLHLARNDIAALARYFEFYGGASDKHHGETIPYLNDYSVTVVREPLGVTGHIIPWNYPSQLFGRTACSALAAGNAVVVKPSEEACQSVLLISRIASEAGLPNGALNIVTGYGDEAGHALASHPDINLLTFTGSPCVGTLVQQAAAKNHVRCVLELGGKSPQVVFDDANLEKAVPAVISGFIQNTGQTCSAGTRLLVQESIYSEVVEMVAAGVKKIRTGMPDRDVECGPIITKAQFKRVQDFIERIKATGIKLIAQGELDTVEKGGFFVPPMVFGPVPSDHELAREEVFGPVLAVIPFKDEAHAVALANDTDYGLVAGVWTENGSRQHRMARAIAAGQVFINCYGAGGGVELPFGGVKKSGYGREKGLLALDEFTTTKTIVNHYQ